MHLLRRRQAGQSIVVIALFAVMLFSFVGLGIDSGMLYIERRHLQNVADAACLAASTEIARGSTQDPAAVAKDYVERNFAVSANAAFRLPPSLTAYLTNEKQGTGSGMTNGVEVTGTSVRVAIQLPAYTYFLRLVKFNEYSVLGRAHCDATKGGGVWPVAINRYPAYMTNNQGNDVFYGNANTGASLPQYPQGNGQSPNALKVVDILQAQYPTGGSFTGGVLNQGPLTGSETDCSNQFRNWYDWNTAPFPNLGNPADRTGPYGSPCQAAARTTPSSLPCNDQTTANVAGRCVMLLGQGAAANVGSSSFSGPLMMDVRHVSTDPRQTYNDFENVPNNVNAFKELVADYIRGTYPGPLVIPGEEIGVLDGVNTGNIIDAVDDRYVGGGKETVVALVYNGQVYTDPDFTMTVTCMQNTAGTPNPNCNNSGNNSSGNFVYRDPEPSTFFTLNNTGTQCSYSGAPYIASADYSADFQNAPLLTGNAHAFAPAKYLISIAPATDTATQISLVARMSGANENQAGASSPGNHEGLSDTKVRWSSINNAGQQVRLTGWQDPDVPLTRPLTLDGLKLMVEVIQTEVEDRTCVTPDASIPDYKIKVPKRASGAHTIEFVATSSIGGLQVSQRHVRYGQLGMRTQAGNSNNYAAGDYFFTFVDEPSQKVIYDSAATTTLTARLIPIRSLR